jgi:hypothetical protein
MKLTLIPWAVAPALVAPLLLSDTNTSGLVRVQAQQLTPVPAPDLSAWKDRLTARDLDRREQAYGDFVAALRQDPSLRRAVEEWRGGSDTDLAWTSRLALREVNDASGGALRRAPFSGQGFAPNDLRSRLDDMQRQFGDLDHMFEDFERRLNQAPGGMGQNPRSFAPNGTTQEHQSYSLEVTPDGVKVEVEENVNGKVEKKLYEAKTLDELYAANPELKDKLGAHVDIPAGPHGLWPGFDDNHPFGGLSVPRSGGGMRSFTPLPLAGEMRTDRLGVGVEIPTADERKSAHIDDGVGLKVMSVEPNSIGSKIGIEPGDVVIEVNGRTVKGVPDVLEVLAQRKLDQDVVVTVVDADAQKRMLTWKASAVSADRFEDKRKL